MSDSTGGSETPEVGPDMVLVPKRQIHALLVLVLFLVGAIGWGYLQVVNQNPVEEAADPRTILGPKATNRVEQKQFVVPVESTLMSGQPLLEALQGGGYVLYARHFHTDHSRWHKDPIKDQHGTLTLEDFLTCQNQRELTDYGRRRARRVGELMRQAKVPVGKIYASPYCRVSEGLEIMMGRKPDELRVDLIYRGGKWTREKMSKALLKYLGEKPAPGTNLLVMAHRPQMDDIARIREGEIFVFEPLGGERFNLVARIHDSEWFEALVDPAFLGLSAHRGGDHR